MTIYVLPGQELAITGIPVVRTKSSQALDEQFHEYQLFRVETPAKLALKSLADKPIKISIGQTINANLVLFESELISPYHIITTEGGNQLNIPMAIPYEGYVMDDGESEVRLTLSDNYLLGYIKQGHVTKYIEPASKFDPSIKPGTYVVYDEQKVKAKTGQGPICAVHEKGKQSFTPRRQYKSNGCSIVEMAIAMDNSYITAYGGQTEAINQTIAILNLVGPNYTSSFTRQIRFAIVEHFVPGSSEPWTSSANANTLLDSFTAWGNSGFTATHDIGQFWTDRDIYGVQNGQNVYGVAGLAWVGATCGGSRYHILEDYTSISWGLRMLTAHEMGHNFGSGHTNTGIMKGSITENTNVWEQSSINQINAHINNVSCYDECLIGSCSEISSAITSSCEPGSSTYTLTLTVLHGGGGSSTGFNVIIDGQSYAQNWTASPQTIVINGLTADGEQGNLVTLSANDNSDIGCSGSATYNVPPGDCSLTVLENFDNCNIPDGWSISSTNNITVNGGDPLVQYQWKFLNENRVISNYDAYGNASSSLTLDGTCMAIMDDDIFNPTWYTGVVTMQSQDYETADMDILKVEFDYLFHPFEEGGKGANNSYFQVQVWDGSSYVTILNDNTNNNGCSWTNVWSSECKDFFSMDITQYKNDELHFRFVYSDGNSGSWAGMAVVDNFYVEGIIREEEEGCNPVTIISGSSISGTFSASQMIETQGPTNITGTTIFSSSEVEIEDGFEVMPSAELTISNSGCID